MYIEQDGEDSPVVNYNRPYGNSDIEGDIAEILGISDNKRHEDDYPWYKPEDVKYMMKLHSEMGKVIQIILATGLTEPGEYECEEYSIQWKKI